MHGPISDPRGDLWPHCFPIKRELKRLMLTACGIGYYMAKHLKDQGLPVTDINVGETAKDSEKYSNLKAELYWVSDARPGWRSRRSDR